MTQSCAPAVLASRPIALFLWQDRGTADRRAVAGTKRNAVSHFQHNDVTHQVSLKIGGVLQIVCFLQHMTKS